MVASKRLKATATARRRCAMPILACALFTSLALLVASMFRVHWYSGLEASFDEALAHFGHEHAGASGKVGLRQRRRPRGGAIATATDGIEGGAAAAPPAGIASIAGTAGIRGRAAGFPSAAAARAIDAGLPRATAAQRGEFSRSFCAGGRHGEYEYGHMVGGFLKMKHPTKHAPDSWQRQSCYYRNVCYDPRDNGGRGRFLYFPDPSEADPRESGNLHVSLTVLGNRWRHRKGVRWSPRVIANSGVDAYSKQKGYPAAVYDDSASVFTVHSSGFLAANIGHLMPDELMPLFRLMDLFGVATHDVVPLRMNLYGRDKVDTFAAPTNGQLRWHAQHKWGAWNSSFPPENSCDAWALQMMRRKSDYTESLHPKHPHRPNHAGDYYIRLCTKMYRKFEGLVTSHGFRLPQVVYGGRTNENDNIHDPNHDRARAQRGAPAPAHKGLVCFDRLLAGIGLLSDHCRDLAFHGQKNQGDIGKQVYDCNAGQGPTVFRWRAFAMRGVGLDPDALPCDAGARGLPPVVVMSIRRPGSRFDQQNVDDWLAMGEHLARAANVAVVAVDFSKLKTARDELEAVASATVLLTFCGGSSHVGYFLPRGATALLVCEGDDARGPRRDGQIWTHLSYLRDVWLDIDHFKSPMRDKWDPIVAAVKQGVRDFDAFGRGDGGPPRPACGGDAFRVFGGAGALKAGRLTLRSPALVGAEAREAAKAARAEKERRARKGIVEGKDTKISPDGYESVTCRWRCEEERELCFCEGRA